MYAKNSLGSLGRIHPNALMKNQSPSASSFKPLSEIQNSLQKLKAKKKKGSKSKSKSKENTPQDDRSAQRRSSIGSQRKTTYQTKVEEKPKQPFFQRNTKKSSTQLSDHINSIVGSYDSNFVKTSSQLSILSRNLTESNSTSCAGSEYQLPMNSQFAQKCVKFSDKHIEINMSRMQQNRPSQKGQDRVRTPSILKKRLSGTNSRSSSIKSATKLSRAKDLMEMENINAGKLIKAKYEALIKKYQDLNKKFNKNLLKSYQKLEKYTDDIFPPQNSSIFSYSIHSKGEKPKTNITWKRIPELYTNEQNLIILRQENTKSLIKITKKDLKNEPSLAEDLFVTGLNCIRENKNLLERMFQMKEMNLFGVYLVRIFEENSWKYVVVDDLIPVIYDDLKQIYVPAFVNVERAEGNNSDTIQIWPYLLQKAYASYYSKYSALKYGTEADMISEFTGVPYKIYEPSQIDFQGKQHLEIQNLLKQGRGVVLGQKITDSKSTFFCILPDLNTITKKSQGFCTALCRQKAYKPIKQKLQTFLTTLTHIYVYDLNVSSNCHISYLCPNTKKNQEGSFKFKPPTQSVSQSKEDGDVILRCFTINETTKGILSIRQKDCKFYFQGKVQYKYIWIRAILLLKQHNGDYRWIDGQYTNKKHLTFFLKLQPGEYNLLLMPQWSPLYKYDATISFFTDCPTVVIEKKPYMPKDLMFEKGCADIAQRQGSMNQINKYICAYNYVSEKTGLVIENINNERENGPVTVMRSINGLKCQVSLVPVNMEFYSVPNGDYDNEMAKKIRKTIEVDIEANQHFTVVLKTMGGIDKKFFDSFDFGS